MFNLWNIKHTDTAKHLMKNERSPLLLWKNGVSAAVHHTERVEIMFFYNIYQKINIDKS